MNCPRVLVLGNVLAQPPGGVARHTREVLPRAARLLAESGGELVVLNGSRALQPADLGEARSLASDLPAGPPLLRLGTEGRVLRATLRSEARAGQPVDVVHTAQLPLPFGRLPGDPALVWLTHDLRRARTRAGRWIIRRALRRATGLVTVSRFVARELADLAPEAREKTAIALNGSDHFTPLPRSEQPEYLLHLGHLEPRKNVDLLLHALAQDETLPDLLCAGAAKPGELERLQALVGTLHLSGRVRFAGPFDDQERAELLARAACVVVPSWLEGFGLAAAEALRAGAPLAIARAGALPEVAGPYGVSFRPERADECARAIHTAIARSASELERGQRHAQRYRWDRSAIKLVEAWTRFHRFNSSRS